MMRLGFDVWDVNARCIHSPSSPFFFFFFFFFFFPANHRVADVNQSLIDDGLVDKEKIGGSNYFWSFPAKKDRQHQLKYESMVQEIEKIKTILPGIEAALMDAKRGREDEVDVVAPKEDASEAAVEANEEEGSKSDLPTPPPTKKFKSTGRAATLQRLEAIAKEKAECEAEAAALKENDPQALADLEKELQLTTQAANRWTDNIFNCKSYLVKKRGMDKKDACKIIGITSAFDCEYTL
jgi:Leucine zipper with capping helix domain/Mnd1 HTH domain